MRRGFPIAAPGGGGGGGGGCCVYRSAAGLRNKVPYSDVAAADGLFPAPVDDDGDDASDQRRSACTRTYVRTHARRMR